MENLEIWVLMGTGVKFVVENAIFRIADPKLPTVFTMQLFLNYRATMMIKGSLIWSISNVKRFR